MSDASFGIVSTESTSIERSSVAPVAFSSFPPAMLPAAQPPRLRWVVTSLLPVLSFVLAGAVAYASPPPKYQGPPAQPAITMPDVIVMDQPAESPAPSIALAPELSVERDNLAPPVVPSVWVYDLPIAGHAARRAPPAVHEAPLTLSPDELPVVR